MLGETKGFYLKLSSHARKRRAERILDIPGQIRFRDLIMSEVQTSRKHGVVFRCITKSGLVLLLSKPKLLPRNKNMIHVTVITCWWMNNLIRRGIA